MGQGVLYVLPSGTEPLADCRKYTGHVIVGVGEHGEKPGCHLGQGVLYIVPPCPKPGTNGRKYTGHAFVCFREPVREPLAYTLENGNQAIPQILKKLFDVRHQIVYKFPERPAIIVKKFKGSGKWIDYQQ